MDPSSNPAKPAKWTDRLKKFAKTVDQAKAEAAAKAAEADQKEAEAHALQRQYENLYKELDQTSDKLMHADGNFATFQSAAKSMRQEMINFWGQSHADGSALKPPHYGDLVAIEAAIADYPRIREQLVQKVDASKRALSEFEREHL
jgi:FtsZ-interacting cell division protein YlmF